MVVNEVSISAIIMAIFAITMVIVRQHTEFHCLIWAVIIVLIIVVIIVVTIVEEIMLVIVIIIVVSGRGAWTYSDSSFDLVNKK